MVLSPTTMTPASSSSPGTTPTASFSASTQKPMRPHSASVSSVHFADTLPHRLSNSDDTTPPRSATFPITNGDKQTSPSPSVPAPTPIFLPSPPQISSRVSSGSVLAHGKRASVVTGGYESSSSDSDNDHAHRRHASQQYTSANHSPSRPRARSLVQPSFAITRSGSDRSLQRANKPSKLTASRHSSRDILRSSVFRQQTPNPSSSRSSDPPISRSTDRMSPGPKSRDASPSRLRQTATPDSARSRKGKEKAEPRRDILASSLGGGARGAALTADQINELLADSDVGAAIRIMGNPAPDPRPRSSSPTRTPQSRQPFLVSAPPPLIQDSLHNRERTFSTSTTTSAPRQANRSRSGIPSADTLARRRASSRGTLGMDGDGGHVPFTHFVPPTITVESDEGETAATTEIDTKPEIKAKKKRISMLFGLKHKRSDSSTQTDLVTDTVPMERRENVKREADKEKERKDAEMREKERQRRNDEIEEDRYFRALQQVSAHPHCGVLADQAKLHLWAHYQHVFDGLENPPRFNPVAILRWKHKVEEQEAARKAWDSRNKHLGASVESLNSSTSGSKKRIVGLTRWAYTMDDIERYNDTGGHVNYFIPPRVTGTSLASVNELTALEHPDNESTKGSIVMQEEVPLRAVSNPSSTDLLRRAESQLSFEPLSRSPSSDNRPRKISHRAHQSLGHIGPASIGHALKAPFDKLGSIARRQLTLPNGDASDSTMEDSPLRAHPLRHSTSPTDRLDPDHSQAQRSKADRFLLRRPADSAKGSLTDDENRESRRRLFLKGERTRPRRAEPGGVIGDRQAELLALEGALQREARWREQQDAQGRRTKAEEEARKKLRDVEVAIYTERSRKLKEASGSVYRMGAALAIVEDNIKHYSLQMEQTRHSIKVGTGLDIAIDKGESSQQTQVTASPPSSATVLDGSDESNNPPSRKNTAERYNRDRLAAAGHKLIEVQHGLEKLEHSRADTAAQLKSMVDELRIMLGKRNDVDRWSKGTMKEIEALTERRNRLQSRFNAQPPWWKSRHLDAPVHGTFSVLGTLYQGIRWMVVTTITILQILTCCRRRVPRTYRRVSWGRHLVEWVLVVTGLYLVATGLGWVHAEIVKRWG